MTQYWEQFVDYFSSSIVWLADSFAFAGGHRWALAIVAVTIIVRTLVLPLAIKQIRSMRETQRLQPEVARLRQKYKADRQKQMQEMQALYQREGVNPYASCLPMIAQAPVFMAMYYSMRDLTKTAGEMPFLGLADLTEQASRSVGGWLLIVLMTAAQLVSTRMLNPGQTDQQRRLQMMMPLLFVIFFINFPAALVLYWATQSLYQFVQQIIMTRDLRMPGSGWRGILGLSGTAKTPTKQGPRSERREEKPQVRPPAAAPAERTAQTVDVLASRRDLEEKRQQRRRRRKKKKQRKR